MYDLVDDDLQEVIWESETLHESLHGYDMAYMIRTKDVDALDVPSLELVEVVGRVGKCIGRLSITPYEYPILVVTEIRRAQPDSVILLIDNTSSPKLLKNAIIPSILDEVPFREPGIERDAHFFQCLANRRQHKFLPVFFYGSKALFIKLRTQLRPLSVVDGLRQIRHICPLITFIGHSMFQPQHWKQVMRNRLREELHLRPIVIDVVLTVHIISLGLQKCSKNRSERCSASVAYVQGSGRVGTHELYLDLLAVRLLLEQHGRLCAKH